MTQTAHSTIDDTKDVNTVASVVSKTNVFEVK